MTDNTSTVNATALPFETPCATADLERIAHGNAERILGL